MIHSSCTAFTVWNVCDESARKNKHSPSIATVEDFNVIIPLNQAVRDIKALDEELSIAEQNFIETMEQEQVVQTRLADRTLRPPGELTRDEVDRRLRDELGRLRHFMKHMRSNIERITCVFGFNFHNTISWY